MLAGAPTANSAPASNTGAQGTATDDQLAALAYYGGWRHDNIITATAIAIAESQGEITASHVNSDGSTDYGLWEVNSSHFTDPGWKKEWTPPDLLLPTNNVRAAYRVYWTGGGFHAWTTYQDGTYKQYMDRARKAYAAAASGAKGDVKIPTSWLGLPNWLAGYGIDSQGNPIPGQFSLFGKAGDAYQSIGDFFKQFNLLSALKLIGGGIILLIGIYILIKGI